MRFNLLATSPFPSKLCHIRTGHFQNTCSYKQSFQSSQAAQARLRNQKSIKPNKVTRFSFFISLIYADWGSLIGVVSLFSNIWGSLTVAASLGQHTWGSLIAVASWGQPIILVKLRNLQESRNIAWGTEWQNWHLWEFNVSFSCFNILSKTKKD